MPLGKKFSPIERHIAKHLYVERQLELKEVEAVLHVFGEGIQSEKWKKVQYGTIQKWAKAEGWEQERKALAGIDEREPVPSFWELDDDIIRRRMALSEKLHGRAMNGRTEKIRMLASRLYLESEKALEAQNVRREFFSNREPQVVMEAIIRVARMFVGQDVEGKEVMEKFNAAYREIAEQKGMMSLAGGAV